MHRIALLAALAAMTACSQEPASEPNEAAAAEGNLSANAATPAAFSLNGTTWTYTKDGKATRTTIDPTGAYVSTAGSEHLDHGTVAMADGKACFTSAMNKDGPECWTVEDTPVGASMESTSDMGEKLTVTRVEYVAPAPVPAAS